MQPIHNFFFTTVIEKIKFAILKTERMSRLLLLFVFMSVVISCTKVTDTPAETYYIKAKFNGELKEFKKLLSAQRGINNGSIVHLVLGGSQNEGSGYPTLDLEIWDLTGNITTGTYSEISKDVIARYSTDAFKRHNSIGNGAEDLTITITEISATAIKGNFSGTITNDAGENILLTEGSFSCLFDY